MVAGSSLAKRVPAKDMRCLRDNPQRPDLINILSLGGGVFNAPSLTACRVAGYHPREICGALD